MGRGGGAGGSAGGDTLERHSAPVFTTQILVTYDNGCEQQQRKKTYALDELSEASECRRSEDPESSSGNGLLVVRAATHTCAGRAATSVICYKHMLAGKP